MVSKTKVNAGIDVMVEEGILSEIAQCKRFLRRITDVTMFQGKRGLAFRGLSLRIGDAEYGNFLGILELFARYHPALQVHIAI